MKHYDTCECCGKKITQKERNARYMNITSVFQCSKCGAIMGTCIKGESYKVRLPRWKATESPSEDWQYYSLTILGSNGIEHVHGWVDKNTREILQTG